MNSVLVIIYLGTLVVLGECMISTNWHHIKDEAPCLWIFWRPRRPATTTKPSNDARTPFTTPATSATSVQTPDSAAVTTATPIDVETIETTSTDISAAPTPPQDAQVISTITV